MRSRYKHTKEIKLINLLLGHCYSFNSGFDLSGQKVPLKSSIRAGSSYGLRVTFYVKCYEKLLPLNGGNNYNLYTGLIVIINNSSYVIQKTLPKPFSNCDIDNQNERYESTSDLYDLIKNSNYQYSQQLCFEVCTFREIIKQCNCTQTDKYS